MAEVSRFVERHRKGQRRRLRALGKEHVPEPSCGLELVQNALREPHRAWTPGPSAPRHIHLLVQVVAEELVEDAFVAEHCPEVGKRHLVLAVAVAERIATLNKAAGMPARTFCSVPLLDLAGRIGDDGPPGSARRFPRPDVRRPGGRAAACCCSDCRSARNAGTRQDVQRIGAGDVRTERAETAAGCRQSRCRMPSMGALPGSPAISC